MSSADLPVPRGEVICDLGQLFRAVVGDTTCGSSDLLLKLLE